MGLLEDLKFDFVMIYIIHKMLVLHKKLPELSES